MKIGLDVGSTTLKCVVLDNKDTIIYRSYERHFSKITQKVHEMLSNIIAAFPTEQAADISISGSAGMGLAEDLHIPFVQEVYATRIAVRRLLPDSDAVIELGGEDAKILFLNGGLEVRMNGSCAGGTGAFIDQMATLLHISLDEMNDLAKTHEKIYTIASRCGVFAKSDIQPLLNQGAQKNDIAASIFAAVVNQTIAGLAQGRDIKGHVVYLGGPLSFLSELRASFDRILKIEGICPENSLYYVALGAAYSASGQMRDIASLADEVAGYHSKSKYISCAPLFREKSDYEAFLARHNSKTVSQREIATYEGKTYLGIDAGSTTVKAVLIDEENQILFSEYLSNSGNPVPIVKGFLEKLYNTKPGLVIAGATVTGYGEEIIKNAFQLDYGIVETMAHFLAAKQFRSDVDFIIDIGGQDIKCFKIVNGVIDNIFLNEACSSGCGSFLQTFAQALGYTVADFAAMGLFGDNPVDLGSRCTVFMNSSVKQAQKDGASVENISAGLSISVVKNAIYKVIRAPGPDALGKNIVVQGGTFLNDAVLRAFEKELGREVVRPVIAGLMGAYGAALYAKKQNKEKSTILSQEELGLFTHEVKATTCKGCSNHCRLTINTFGGFRRESGNRIYIGGNRCEKPLSGSDSTQNHYNLYEYKADLLASYKPEGGSRGRIGIPMGLNLFELLPFWHAFFTSLGFAVVTSPPSTRKLYLSGQHTIPSDTVCYPAKIMHGHIEALIAEGVETIFYPCMSYNLEEGLGDNHYNCPVVAYYPEVIKANVPQVEQIRFIYSYLGLHRPKDFVKKIHKILNDNFGSISLSEVKTAAQNAYDEYYGFLQKIKDKGVEYLALAKREKMPVIILAGRPYHLDGEINHGIDRLLAGFGAVILSEDSLGDLFEKNRTKVLNQWTYHARLYAAAEFVAKSNDPNINLVQLVSFGCGVDAITTDEVRSILESAGRIYTQIKIDEITNLGAVKIRLRSLFAALENENRKETDGLD